MVLPLMNLFYKCFSTIRMIILSLTGMVLPLMNLLYKCFSPVRVIIAFLTHHLHHHLHLLATVLVASVPSLKTRDFLCDFFTAFNNLARLECLSLRKVAVSYESDTEDEGKSWKEDHGDFRTERENSL